MRTLAAKALIATFALAGFLALNTGQALATHIGCGDVITQDTTLDSDLIDCPDVGIVIGADDITLDLNGHTIDSDGRTAMAGIDNGLYEGFLSGEGHDGVVIENGVVREFSHGIILGGASHNVLRGLKAVGGANGIVLAGKSNHNLVTGNQALDNGQDYAESAGISLSGIGPGNRVQRNFVSGNFNGVLLDGGFSDGTRIERNWMSRNRYGISFFENAMVGTVIAKNLATDNGAGMGLFRVQDARIERNRVFRSSYHGIYLSGDSSRTLIEHNSVGENGEDGIYIGHPSADLPGEAETTLTRNRAYRNGDLGIEAVPGFVIDGGGNRAFGNGNPLQCLNVACK